jgi:3-oxosteroid 1-dehydrogenase
MEEALKVPLARTTWGGKFAQLKIGLRILFCKLTGKSLVTFGAALQGQMFLKALKAGVDMRANAAVEQLVSDESGLVTGVVAQIWRLLRWRTEAS